MLKNEILEDVDLASVKAELKPKIEDRFQEYLTEDQEVIDLKYPVEPYEKVKSVGFDKLPEIEGRLMGIKGQYLLLDENRVLNMREAHRLSHYLLCLKIRQRGYRRLRTILTTDQECRTSLGLFSVAVLPDTECV